MPFCPGVPIFVWVLINSDVVVVIKIGAYIHGVLTFNGCLLSRFIVMFFTIVFVHEEQLFIHTTI